MSEQQAELVDGQIAGECERCGDSGLVYSDNNRCEDCDSRIYRCGICNEDQHENDLCRHLFQDENFEWRGSGVGSEEGIKEPFLRLLALMPDGFASALKEAITR